MRDPDRKTDPPPPPRPRPKQASVRDVDPPALSDRELLLRALATVKQELSAELEQRMQQSQRRLSEAPKRHNWGDLATKLVAAVSLIAATLANLKPAKKDERVDDAYEKLASAVTTVQSQQQLTDSSVKELRAWLAGYFISTGVKVVDPPGSPAPARVELLPAPLQRGRAPSSAPTIQVNTPLPLPPPSAAPVKLAPKLAP